MNPRDEYTRIEPSRHGTLNPCPLCGSDAEAWRHRESESVSTVAICCTKSDAFGPQESDITSSGCAFYMPPAEFYRSRIRDAVEYWNSYGKAIEIIRRQNSWERHSALRKPSTTGDGGEK